MTYIQNFGVGASCKTVTWKTEKELGGKYKDGSFILEK
jgi:hypothetical protein